MVITKRKMHRSSYINWRINNYQRQIARSVSTMKTTKLSVIVSCVCVLLVLDKLVYNVSAFGGRILNGNVADPADYKFLIHIMYEDIEIIWRCGGSVISNHFILTAAHCLYDRVCTQIELHPSAWVLDDPPTYYAAQCHIHDNYNDDTFGNDIGLVQTGENLLANPQITKIDLPAPGTVYDVGTVAQIAGFGQMEDKDFPDMLMHATVRVIDWQMCHEEFGTTLSEHEFCTAGNPPNTPGACVGDSGGPAIIAGQVAGLISSVLFRNDECLIGSPTVHVRVADYIPWIGKFVDF